MASTFGTGLPQSTPPMYSNHTILGDLSRQQTNFLEHSGSMPRCASSRRMSSAMRVVKPSSANNSPQAMATRRRTLVNDSNIARRRQQALDQAILEQIQDTSSYHNRPQRSTRPVSWHPSTHFSDAQHMQISMPQTNINQLATAIPTPFQNDQYFQEYQNIPSTPAVYSGHTSPVSDMSPLLLPYNPTTQSTLLPAYVSSNSWIPAPQIQTGFFDMNDSSGHIEPFPAYASGPSFSWQSYSPRNMQSCTAPPTPDECQGTRQPQSVPLEEPILYQEPGTPDMEEEDGEIFFGMGLYDLPTKDDADPELEHYHTTTSQLLGTTYRSGKGWKLEEAWEPPATDDEDTEEDADGEDQDDEPPL